MPETYPKTIHKLPTHIGPDNHAVLAFVMAKNKVGILQHLSSIRNSRRLIIFALSPLGTLFLCRRVPTPLRPFKSTLANLCFAAQLNAK